MSLLTSLLAPGNGTSRAFPSGRYIAASSTATVSTAQKPADLLLFAPFDVERPVTLDSIGCEVTTAGSAGTVIRLGIYADNKSVPGALVLDAGTVAGDSTGAKVIAINQLLTPARYWVASVTQNVGAGTAPTVRTAIAPFHGVGDTDALVRLQQAGGCYKQTAVAGPLPALAAAAAGMDVNPHRIVVRAA